MLQGLPACCCAVHVYRSTLLLRVLGELLCFALRVLQGMMLREFWESHVLFIFLIVRRSQN